MSKDVFYMDESFDIVTERIDKDSLAVHCQVDNWSHTVAKKVYVEFARLVDNSERQGYKYLEAFSLSPKFCEMMCFTDMGLTLEHENKIHAHYRYVLGGL
jgi:hypothetical protein